MAKILHFTSKSGDVTASFRLANHAIQHIIGVHWPNHLDFATSNYTLQYLLDVAAEKIMRINSGELEDPGEALLGIESLLPIIKESANPHNIGTYLDNCFPPRRDYDTP